MTKVKSFLFPISIFSALVLIASFVFEIPFLASILLIIALFFCGGVVTEGEYMPGQTDNPDGQEIHPYVVLGSLALVFVVLVFIGYLYPILFNYGF